MARDGAVGSSPGSLPGGRWFESSSRNNNGLNFFIFALNIKPHVVPSCVGFLFVHRSA